MSQKNKNKTTSLLFSINILLKDEKMFSLNSEIICKTMKKTAIPNAILAAALERHCSKEKRQKKIIIKLRYLK